MKSKLKEFIMYFKNENAEERIKNFVMATHETPGAVLKTLQPRNDRGMTQE